VSIELANHLWQSTLFASLAWLLALALRRNSARARHWVWLAASIKFLVPFSLLFALGSSHAPATARELAIHLPYSIDQISRPLASPAAHLTRSAPPSLVLPLTAVLLAVWVLGLMSIARERWAQWQRLRAIVRVAAPVDMPLAIAVRSTSALIEPGVFGILRPVLLVPADVATHLTPPQLRAVLAHELCHVRRHDNLAAAIHMTVEAIFWFHPLVWWIGARLVEERERACDEEVVRQGNEPETYAEGILAACRLYLRSPMACVSGVAGGDLRGRIERIVNGDRARTLGPPKILLVAVCALAAVLGPVALGFAAAPPSGAQTESGAGFEVASIKQSAPNIRGMNIVPAGGKLVAKNVPLDWLIAEAYQVYPYRLLNTPAWVRSARYDIQAKASNPQANKAELHGMLRSLLADRFHLSLHRETKQLPVYALVAGKGGPRLQPPEHPEGPHGVDYRNGGTVLIGRNATMDEFADALSFRTERSVTNRTGLTERYDFRLEFTPDEFVRRFGEETATPIDASGTNLFTSIQEQLGLKLESGKGPVEMLVIDRVDRPTEN
jgi:uncharacterized protein (TIGR03435 family)